LIEAVKIRRTLYDYSIPASERSNLRKNALWVEISNVLGDIISVRSLQLFTQTWNIVPNINDKLFEALKVKLSILPLIERHYVLCADEMSLKSFLFDDISRNEIINFEDFGNRKTSVPSKSALVIMARSIAGNWKLPIYFCFIETACPATFLKNMEQDNTKLNLIWLYLLSFNILTSL
ncbi:hypothetical protein ALC57_10402, partial [Trachymyrmex cornetzi]